jgi:HTH-type transcriptional regulator/antitoxin HigA
MIKNEQQLAVTQRQLKLLSDELRRLEHAPEQGLLRRAMQDSLKADIRKLRREIETFSIAKAGDVDLPALQKIDHFGELLVQARLAKGMTQEDLANVLGQKPQQVQRYERELYRRASLETLIRVAAAVR